MTEPEAAYQRRKRAQNRAARQLINGRLIAPLPPERHGRESTYNNWGCQCDPCRQAHRDRQRAETTIRKQHNQTRLARIRQAAGKRR